MKLEQIYKSIKEEKENPNFIIGYLKQTLESSLKHYSDPSQHTKLIKFLQDSLDRVKEMGY